MKVAKTGKQKDFDKHNCDNTDSHVNDCLQNCQNCIVVHICSSVYTHHPLSPLTRSRQSPARATSPEGEEMLSEQDDEETIEDDNPEPDSTSLR